MRIVLALGVCALLLAGCGPGMWESSAEAGHQPTTPAYRQPTSPAYELPAATLPEQPQQPATTPNQGQATVTQGHGQAAKDDAICRSYGTFPGTTPYVKCRLGLRQQEIQSRQNESPLQSLFD